MDTQPPSPVLSKIAYFQNRRDDVPNQELARELAKSKNEAGIREIASNLWSKNKNIRSDCLKVLYEIGYIEPGLIADYVDDFLRLLKDKNNRLVWGAMIALASIADRTPIEIWVHIDDVMEAVEHGSVITLVWGIRTLAKIAASDKKYQEKISPILIQHLKTCIPRDLPTHAESILCAIDRDNQQEFLTVIETRRSELTPSQLVRLKKVIKQTSVS